MREIRAMESALAASRGARTRRVSLNTEESIDLVLALTEFARWSSPKEREKYHDLAQRIMAHKPGGPTSTWVKSLFFPSSSPAAAPEGASADAVHV